MIYKILKYFWYISNDDMITIVSETCKTLEKDFKQEKDRLINLISEKDRLINNNNLDIDFLENDLNYCRIEKDKCFDDLCKLTNIIEELREANNNLNKKNDQLNACIIKLKDKNKVLSLNNNVLNSRSTSAIKSRDNWKDKYNKLVWKIALKNATHK